LSSKSWYKIKAQGSNAAEITLRGLVGDPDAGIDADTFLSEIDALGDVDELKVKLNSKGGSFFVAVPIQAKLKNHPAKVTVEIEGLAASAASYIATAGDVVTIPSNGWIMIHNSKGSLIQAEVSDMLRTASLMDDVNTDMVGAYSAKTGIPEERIRAMMDAETWIKGPDAVAMGFADALTDDVKIAAEFDGKTYDRTPETLIIAQEKEPKNMAEPKQEEPKAPEVSEADIQARIDAAVIEAREEGIKSERDRIQSIEAIALAGHDELIAKAKADSTITAEILALDIVAAEKKLKESAAEGLKAQAVKPVETVVEPQAQSVELASMISAVAEKTNQRKGRA